MSHSTALEPGESVEPGRAGSLRRLWRLDPQLVAIGVLGGVLSGLLGVGGGIIMVPLLVLLGPLRPARCARRLARGDHPDQHRRDRDVRRAGKVHSPRRSRLAAGSVLGARLGAGMLARIDERLLKLVFGVFLLRRRRSLMVRAR